MFFLIHSSRIPQSSSLTYNTTQSTDVKNNNYHLKLREIKKNIKSGHNRYKCILVKQDVFSCIQQNAWGNITSCPQLLISLDRKLFFLLIKISHLHKESIRFSNNDSNSSDWSE